MGGFFIASKTGGVSVHKQLLASRRHFGRAGFHLPVTVDTDAYTADYYPKIGQLISNHVTFDNGDFIFAAGTFLYGGLIGVEALKLFFRKKDPHAALSEARGHFVLVLRKDGKTSLFRDRMGAYNVFSTPGLQAVTSSFTAAAAVTDTRTINPHEVYEYVVSGGTFGSDTPIAEIRRLDLFEWIRWNSAPEIIHQPFETLLDESIGSYSELIGRNLFQLLAQAGELGNHFGNNIRMALAGGYDSRLLLALFRRNGTFPKLFVYGAADDPEIILAKRIADAEKLDLLHIDKSQTHTVDPAGYPVVVEENFFQEDGIPSGGIFTTGAEMEARAERNSGGALHVNGGGGEIFRNFFNLTNRSVTPHQFIWLFYRALDPAQCTDAFDTNVYESRLAEKIVAMTGLTGRKLTRRQVESLYPFFRCRSWFGPENTVNNRFGYSVLPFVDYRTSTEALRIPVKFKYFGNFESALIRSADLKLAAHNSNYGHNFASNASIQAKFWDILTYYRPFRVRRHAAALKARLTKPAPRPAPLSDAYLSRVIDIRFPYMSKFFRMDRITFDYQFARICTLEYLFQHLQAR